MVLIFLNPSPITTIKFKRYPYGEIIAQICPVLAQYIPSSTQTVVVLNYNKSLMIVDNFQCEGQGWNTPYVVPG